MQVYAKIGILGLRYYKDDGLFVERISKKQYDEIVAKSEKMKLEKKLKKQLEKELLKKANHEY